MAGTRPSAPMPVEAPAAPVSPTPVQERFSPQHPTIAPQPAYDAVGNTCGDCPGWKRHPRLPFGQCLPAMQALGAPMYTPDLASCSLPPEAKAKAGRR